MNTFEKLLKKPVYFDGALGTVIQSLDIEVPSVPEELNITRGESIAAIHANYILSGCNVITTNSFGANSYKTKNSSFSLEEIIKAAVKNARTAVADTDTLIAYDIGPIGRMMKPIGTLTFDEAYDYFKEQIDILDEKSVDLVIIETMADLNEARAAILAVKENSNLPVFATMTFAEDGRTITGTTPEIMVACFEALGVDALGVNCSLGPKQLLPIIKRITDVASKPVIVQANAGIPTSIMGKTVFSVDASEYTRYAAQFISYGASVIGGCCGTNYEYMRQVIERTKDLSIRIPEKVNNKIICSQTTSVNLNNEIVLIGERINPSGNKKLKEAFLRGDVSHATKVAFEQIEKGAKILDVCTSLPEVDEVDYMNRVLDEFSGLIEVPLQFDSTSPKVLESALRKYPGIAIINSVNGKQESMDQIFPLAKKYGAYLVALCFDEEGIPNDSAKRVEVADKLIENAKKHGISEDRLLVDTLVLTASAQQEGVFETLKAIKTLKEKYEVKTTLGLSNVSFGLPSRPLINRTYFAMALAYGLDTVIINPAADGIVDTLFAYQLLANIDKDCVNYIDYIAKKEEALASAPAPELTQKKSSPSQGGKKLVIDENSIEKLILEGQKDKTLEKTKDLLKSQSPLEVVDNHLVPSLDSIGRYFEEKKIFLPQLIRAAETVGVAFEHIRDVLNSSGDVKIDKGKIILATVKGDVHDIGKNLVKVLLENYGFTVIDLGKDVPTQAILDAIETHDCNLIGLSALMTTTVDNMEESIKAVKAKYPEKTVFVGGAVLTQDYSKKIGADFYCKDARESVKVAQEFFDLSK